MTVLLQPMALQSKTGFGPRSLQGWQGRQRCTIVFAWDSAPADEMRLGSMGQIASFSGQIVPVPTRSVDAGVPIGETLSEHTHSIAWRSALENVVELRAVPHALSQVRLARPAPDTCSPALLCSTTHLLRFGPYRRTRKMDFGFPAASWSAQLATPCLGCTCCSIVAVSRF
jgi:hypothetical protein